MHLEILDKKRRDLIEKISFVNKFGFYLAGGTGLALQLGHRTSVDFDFYTPESFNPEKVIENFKKIADIEVFMKAEDTLGLITKDGIEITFFKYTYPILLPFKKMGKIKVASIQDIAAMKMNAIVGRGTQRDFIDLYYILKEYGMNNIINWTEEKFPHLSIELLLMSLVYYKDADEDKKSKLRIKMSDEKFDWDKAKDYIEKKVFEFQRSQK